MEEFQLKMQEQGYGNASINRSIASLRAMFTLAYRAKNVHYLPYFPMLDEANRGMGHLRRKISGTPRRAA